LVGDLPRIELFARQKTPDWDVWGNEVESDIYVNIKLNGMDKWYKNIFGKKCSVCTKRKWSARTGSKYCHNKKKLVPICIKCIAHEMAEETDKRDMWVAE
jgi:hypothetical protein